MRNSSPRHLSSSSSPPPPRERGGLIGQLLLIAVTIVIGGLLAMAFTRHGDQVETPTAVPSDTTGAPPSQPPPTASTPAAKPAQGEPTPGSPSSGSSAVGGGNLLRNPGFEDDLSGWRAIGGASLELVSAAREGQQAVSLTAGSGTDPGLTARQVTRCQLHRSYTATAWVRASEPGTTVELNLIEYTGDRRLATDVAGHVLPDGEWQRIEVEHVAHRQGTELAVEVVASGLPRQAELLVDAVEVRLAGKTDAFTPRTT
jgi:hypothetical protein